MNSVNKDNNQATSSYLLQNPKAQIVFHRHASVQNNQAEQCQKALPLEVITFDLLDRLAKKIDRLQKTLDN